MEGKIFVLGSYVVDLMARAPHLPAHGETVMGTEFKMGPGGKGFNQAVAAHKAGGHVTFACKIGNDAFGEYAFGYMNQIKMDTGYVFKTGEFATGAALILVDEGTGQNSIVVTPGACAKITPAESDSIKKELCSSEYLLTQLEINLDATFNAVSAAHEAGVKIILNPAPVQPVSDEMYAMTDILTPNEVEARILTGIEVNDESSALKAAEFFFNKGVKNVIITMGHSGAFVATREKHKLVPAFKVEAVDTTGAGDAFNGGLAAYLAEGHDIWDATAFAQALAALSVQKLGTSVSMPERHEIDSFMAKR